MVLHQGDEEEATTASTASATSETAARALDSSATATPSLGTPSDSLDRNVDPKEIMNSSENIESEPNVSIVAEQQNEMDINKVSNTDVESGLNVNKDDNSTIQAPPPSYSELKQEAITVEKQDVPGNK